MNYNNTVKLNIIRDNPSVVVLTPTTGAPVLEDAIQSVLSQDYKGTLHHHLVVDGKEYNRDFYIRQKKFEDHPLKDNIKFTWLNSNVGKNGFNGQRIYASFPHLLDYDYILFLDEDNYFSSNHVSSLVNLIEKNNYDWAYSFRNIIRKNGTFVVEDCCESVGMWPIFWSLDKPEKQHLIDTSSFCFKKSFIQKTCHLWHSGPWGEDRRYYAAITQQLGHKNFGTTGLHTLNYRLDDEIDRKYGSIDFFEKGNEIMKKYFKNKYPWEIE
jgi:hypothetical protein